MLFEKRLLKEREAEDHLFGTTERFVTAAYKKKLEEDRLLMEEQKRKCVGLRNKWSWVKVWIWGTRSHPSPAWTDLVQGGGGGAQCCGETRSHG